MSTDHNDYNDSLAVMITGMLISFVAFQYQVLFPALWSVIEQIQASKVYQYYNEFYCKPAIRFC